jgi:UrcA family protein
MKTLIAIIVAGLAAGSAAAQDRVAIDYTDIATPSDADVLYHRIQNAAEAVCPRDPVLGLWGYSVSRKCQRNAVAKAVEEVNSPLLTARHHGETGDKLYSSRATRT